MKRVLIASVLAIIFTLSVVAVAGAECVNINSTSITATMIQARLKGVKKAIANRIVKTRKKNQKKDHEWKYEDWAQLIDLIKGIDKAFCEKYRKNVCFNEKQRKECPE